MITVEIHNEFDIQLNKSSIQSLLENILLDNKQNTGSINIIMTDDDTLRLMKKEYFNQDLYTDVIAFNIDDNPFEGEIYISHDRIKDNAKKFNQSFEDELKRILIHGSLHLCGYDDKTPKEKLEMTSLEENYLEKFRDSILS
mgnify:FL=1|tara:strand:- start:231 stop:656 length:426 start_codon:yes stop_codon:yes gene_type:complete